MEKDNFESTNEIETQTTNKVLCPTWNGGAAIHALQNANGTVASWVPGRNPGIWSAVNEGVRWTPICQCPNVAGPNVITGKVFRDDNSNCIQDAGEPRRLTLALDERRSRVAQRNHRARSSGRLERPWFRSTQAHFVRPTVALDLDVVSEASHATELSKLMRETGLEPARPCGH